MSKRSIYSSILGTSSFILGIRITTVLATLLAFILASHRLSYQENTDYISFWLLINVVAAIGSLGITGIIYTIKASEFWYIFSRFSKKSWLYILSFNLLLAISFGATLYFSNDFFSNSDSSISLAIIFCLFYTFSFILEQVLLLFKFFKQQFIINLIFTLGWIGSHWLLLSESHSLNFNLLLGILLLFLLIKVGAYVGLFIYIRRQQAANEIDNKRLLNLKKLWLHLGVYEVIQLVFRYFDKLFIIFIASKVAAAIYFNGRQDIPLLPNIIAAVFSGALLTLSQSKQSRQDYKDALWNSSKIASSITLGAVIFLYINSEYIITLLFSEKYLESVPVFQLGLLLLPLRYCFTTKIALQQLSSGLAINIGALIDIAITVLLSIILYPLMGVNGLVWSIIISTLIQNLYYLKVVSKQLSIPGYGLLPFGNWLLKTVIFISTGWLIHSFVQPQLNSFNGMWMSFLIISSIIALLLYLERNEKTFFKLKTRT